LGDAPLVAEMQRSGIKELNSRGQEDAGGLLEGLSRRKKSI